MMPDDPQSKKTAPPDEAAAFPPWPLDACDGESQTSSRLLINVPAKAGAPANDPALVQPTPDTASGEGEPEEKALEWRRKARSRRMQANRATGEGGAASASEDFEPEFTALRM